MKKRRLIKKGNHGITLIALVITIIVLLLLAGVAIVSLTGENGVLTRASKSKTETEIAEVIEGARVDILGVQAEKEGNITEEEVDSILQPKYGTLSGEGEEKTLTTSKGYQIKVTEIYNGPFKEEFPNYDENTLKIGKAINTNKYGWKVIDYTVKEAETGGWRLFYQDKVCTYLISDKLRGKYKPSDEYTSYTDGSYVSTIGQRLNSQLLNAGTFFTDTNTNTNIRTTAWLTDTSDTSMWNEYKNADAVFAIGSPTAELFAASYNNRSNKSNTITLNVETYGYTENTESGWLGVNENYGIYNKSSSYTSIWWIASPHNDYTGKAEMAVLSEQGKFSRQTETNSFYVRPIVCIPTSVFNSNYTLQDA